jgi:hypothetical protein
MSPSWRREALISINHLIINRVPYVCQLFDTRQIESILFATYGCVGRNIPSLDASPPSAQRPQRLFKSTQDGNSPPASHRGFFRSAAAGVDPARRTYHPPSPKEFRGSPRETPAVLLCVPQMRACQVRAVTGAAWGEAGRKAKRRREGQPTSIHISHRPNVPHRYGRARHAPRMQGRLHAHPAAVPGVTTFSSSACGGL